MSIHASVGIAAGKTAEETAVQAAQEALKTLDVDQADVAIVFASSTYEGNELLKGIRSVVGTETKIIGSSTAGEITGAGPSNQHSISVMLLASPEIKFFTAVSEGIDGVGSKVAGKDVAQKIKTQAKAIGETLKSFMMFPDVLVGNGADIVRGVLEELGDDFPVVGGASGDEQEFVQTFQFLDDEVYSKSVVALGMSGDFSFGVGVRHGWIPIGSPMTVTKSDGSLIQEIDGEPAIKVYEDHFGIEKARVLQDTEAVASVRSVLTYPFGISSKENHEEILIRFATDVLKDGSIRCAAEIPQGSEIRLMIGSKEEAVEAAHEAATQSREGLEGKEPKAAIIFNCIARKNLFGDEARDEINAIREAVGVTTPMIGFYTYGEQAPINGVTRDMDSCETTFHNETVVIYTLG